jgi:hypothetical protein
MKHASDIIKFVWIGIIIVIFTCGVGVTFAEEEDTLYKLPENIYINMTKDFYEALKKNGSNSKRVYGSKMSDEYLRQISVSTKFMAETNLQIIKQQEQVIRLLESISKQSK